METLSIRQTTPALGAEVTGIDLASPLTDLEKNSVRSAFSSHKVLFFRDQQLTPACLTRFAGLFGEVGAYPFAQPLAGHPEVIAIIKEPDQTSVFGGIWHTDSTYLEKPSLGSILYAVAVPSVGGDTLFSNLEIAYERLAPETQRQLASLQAIHSSAKNQAALRKDHLDSGSMKGNTKSVKESCHPVLRTHPVTGKISLYISPAHTIRFKGQSIEQSAPLLDHLFTHVLNDDFKCRFRWTKGTMAIWDNRCCLHYPVNDYHGQRREMHRVTIEGDIPTGPGAPTH